MKRNSLDLEIVGSKGSQAVLHSIQYLRAVAALFVLFHHALWKVQQYGTHPLYWFRIGSGGVDLFFIISGYIMCHTTKNPSVRAPAFLEARIVRIIPLYWLLTTVALFIYLIFPEKVNSSGGYTDVFGSYTLLPTGGKYLIQNGWSLSYEFYFYLVFSTGLAFSSSRRHLLPVIIMSVAVVAGFFWKFDALYFRFLTSEFLAEFLLGIIAFHFCERFKINKWWACALLVTAILGMVAVSFGFSSKVRVVDLGLPNFLLFLGFIYLEPIFRLKSESIVSHVWRKLGDSSYSLYLIHPFSLVLTALVLKHLGLSRQPILFLIFLLMASIFSGLICYAYVEKPITRMSRRLNAKIVRRSEVRSARA